MLQHKSCKVILARGINCKSKNLQSLLRASMFHNILKAQWFLKVKQWDLSRPLTISWIHPRSSKLVTLRLFQYKEYRSVSKTKTGNQCLNRLSWIPILTILNLEITLRLVIKVWTTLLWKRKVLTKVATKAPMILFKEALSSMLLSLACSEQAAAISIPTLCASRATEDRPTPESMPRISVKLATRKQRSTRRIAKTTSATRVCLHQCMEPDFSNHTHHHSTIPQGCTTDSTQREAQECRDMETWTAHQCSTMRMMTRTWTKRLQIDFRLLE